MTTDTRPQSAALATRDLTDAQLRTRLDIARRGFGLQEATQPQLNALYLLCQRWRLDPLTDITLYEGRPWVTIDGRLRLLRAHPEYRGYSCKPLTRPQKEEWGYEVDDIVVECVIRTTTWGDISARGKVAAVEVRAARERAEQQRKRPAPIGVHPVEIAEKRAIARAERAAFGQDVMPDDDVLEYEVTEHRPAAPGRRYEDIFSTEEELDRAADAQPAARNGTPPVQEQPAETVHLCDACGKPVLDQAGQPINDLQAAALKNDDGELGCRDCRASAERQAQERSRRRA